MTTSTHVELSGPFFQRNPGLTLRGNITKMMEGLAAEGERAARAGFRATEGNRAPISGLGDRVADHVIGRVSSVSGKHWVAAAVVSINNAGFTAAEGVSLMAAAAAVERRVHVMRSLTRHIRSAKAVLLVNLTQGIE